MATHTYKRTGARSVTFDGDQLATQVSEVYEFELFLHRNGGRYYYTYQSPTLNRVFYADSVDDIAAHVRTFDPGDSPEGLDDEYVEKRQALYESFDAVNINP